MSICNWTVSQRYTEKKKDLTHRTLGNVSCFCFNKRDWSLILFFLHSSTGFQVAFYTAFYASQRTLNK